MIKNILALTYLPDFYNKKETIAGLLFDMVPSFILEMWAMAIGWTLFAVTGSSLLGVVIFLVATLTFHIRWSDLGYRWGNVTLRAQVSIGLLSSVMVYLALDRHMAAAAVLGWVATGMFNFRFDRWFWGPPMVFEMREFGELRTFLLGPFYWLFVFVVGMVLIPAIEWLTELSWPAPKATTSPSGSCKKQGR